MLKRLFLCLLLCCATSAFAREYASTGFYYPLKNESPNFSQCGRWLERHSPNGCYDFKDSFGNKLYHTGSDMMASVGTPVYAIADGVVKVRSTNGWGEDGSNNVALVIEHRLYGGNDTVRVIYGHINSGKFVNNQIRAGEQIGTIGPWSSGSHVHFGILRLNLEFPYNSSYFGRWLDDDYGEVFNGQHPYYDNGLIDPIWFVTHNVPDNWISRAGINSDDLTEIPPVNPWFPSLCGEYPADQRCDSSDVDSYVTCVFENNGLCTPSVDSYSAVNGGGNGSGNAGGGGGGGSYNLNQDTDIMDPATGVEWIAGQKQLVPGQIVNIRVQLQSEGGDVRNYIQAGKDTIEMDYYVRIGSGNWTFFRREYTQTSNLGSGTHTETASYTIPVGISEISFRVKVDAEDEVSEINESDNWSRIETFRVDVSSWLIPLL